MNCNKKGQAISIDLVLAAILFLIAFSIALAIMQNQGVTAEEQLLLNEMQASGEKTLNFLVKSRGETIISETNWEDEESIDNVKFMGLAQRDRVLSPKKMAKFVFDANYSRDSESYSKTKGKILLPYDFYFRFLDRDNRIIKETQGNELVDMVSGKNPDSNTVIILKRIVNYEGTNYAGEAIAELQVFSG